MQHAGKRNNLYYGWIVIRIVFIVLLVAAGISSIPSVLMLQFEEEFGWSRGAVSEALSVRIFLYGLMGSFSASLMAKYGIRRMMLISMSHRHTPDPCLRGL
ncbi:hypothetical protein [Paenibacillus borealis]|uniref:Major facilitator superfamily (MFS) profile domain-containing protein n=1 Tax=Paenibacillus borealis TaxID=160799 RepID=A0A089MPS6_PAEBO|nr:hypothetical protein PBOR_17305 [Paenibacillus borealis]